jgi:uncharacterized protein YjbI with pentapeptide repeats
MALRRLSSALFNCRFREIAQLLLLGLSTSTAFALDRSPANDFTAAERWAWAEIKAGKRVDFNDKMRCNTPRLAARAQDEQSNKEWRSDCRLLRGSFLVQILTKPPWRDEIPDNGVAIVAARIDDDAILLANARLSRALSIIASRIEKDIVLEGARSDSDLEIADSRVNGTLSAFQFYSERTLSFQDSQFLKNVDLTAAKVDGFVVMRGARFDGDLSARFLHVGKALQMDSSDRYQALFKKVTLQGARIDDQLTFNGASIDGNLEADSLQVGASLYMESTKEFKAAFGNVVLRGAYVKGQVSLSGASVCGILDGDSLNVGTHLFLRSTGLDAATFQDIKLQEAHVVGQLDMTGAHLYRALSADSIKVDSTFFVASQIDGSAVRLVGANIGGDLDMNRVKIKGTVEISSVQVKSNIFANYVVFLDAVDAKYANIGSNLDIRDATLAGLDLTGASIGKDLVLGSRRQHAPDEHPHATEWRYAKGEPQLILRNAHVGNLLDSTVSWPEKGQLHIDGFTFSHLGGFYEDEVSDPRKRGADWWVNNWIARDLNYSPHPYQQLATVFSSSGDRDLADEIRYWGYVREQRDKLPQTSWMSWFWSWPLRYVAGFGIYPHWVIYWIAGISIPCAFYLLYRTQGGINQGGTIKDLSWAWCWWASLSRLLPGIEINEEFKKFFEDPERKNLTWKQTQFFSFIRLLGWFLAAVLIAAVTGVTGKP